MQEFSLQVNPFVVQFQGHSNNSPLLIASSKGVCLRYTYFAFNIQRNLVGCHWLAIPSVNYSPFFISGKLLIQILLAISIFHILYPFESASPGQLFSDLDGVSNQSEAYNISSALFLAFARAICFKDLGFVQSVSPTHLLLKVRRGTCLSSCVVERIMNSSFLVCFDKILFLKVLLTNNKGKLTIRWHGIRGLGTELVK